MIKQEHREYKINEGEGFIIVNTKGEKELFKELMEYCKQHPEQHIGYYINPVRPQKGCPIPEYSMEVIINPKGVPLFYQFVQ